MEIKVGDKVRVVYAGHRYTTYGNFFDDNPECVNTLSLGDIARYRNNDNEDMDTLSTYEVLFIGMHGKTGADVCYIKEISDKYDWEKKYYLIQKIGLEVIKPMTKKEIEQALGYAIEIVD